MAASIRISETENREIISHASKIIGEVNAHHIITLVSQELPFYPVILCFASSEGFPDHCHPMKRIPSVEIGQRFSEKLGRVLREAVDKNSSIHDGAIIFQKEQSSAEYSLMAWSVRLAPPNFASSEKENKGSAYNSSLAMSAVAGIEFVVLINSETICFFADGNTFEFELVR